MSSHSSQTILNTLKDVYDKLLDTLKKKNNDYSNEGEFANFENSAEYARITPEQGIVCRMEDKFSRLSNLLFYSKTEVTEESIEDTIHDLIGYAVILIAYRTHRIPRQSLSESLGFMVDEPYDSDSGK